MIRVQRLTIGIILTVLMFGVASGIRGISAQATAAATPAPAPFQAGMLLQLKPGVPYAFLRSTASSNADVVDTAHAGEFVIVLGDAARFDGVQWWWFVERGSGSLAGWVEQNSLYSALLPGTATPNGQMMQPVSPVDTASAPTIAPSAIVQPTDTLVSSATPAPISSPTDYLTPTNLPVSSPVASATVAATGGGTLTFAQTPGGSLLVGTRLIVSPGIPYVFIRGAASSNAYVRATVYPGYWWSTLTVRNSAPLFDGTQNWLLVNVPALNVYGWVEAHSLIIAPIPPTPVPATATLIATSAPDISATPSLADSGSPSSTPTPTLAQ